MKTSVVWIIRIYQVHYGLNLKQMYVLRGVCKLGTFNIFFNILFYHYYLKRSEKRSWKGHGKVIEFHSWISVWTMSWSDWCETKRKCVGWILGTICDLDLWPHSWPWPWMFQGQSSFSGIVGLINVKRKRSELIWYWADCMTLPFDHTHDLDLGIEISRSESEIALSQSGIGWPIDMERKGCESSIHDHYID